MHEQMTTLTSYNTFLTRARRQNLRRPRTPRVTNAHSQSERNTLQQRIKLSSHPNFPPPPLPFRLTRILADGGSRGKEASEHKPYMTMKQHTNEYTCT